MSNARLGTTLLTFVLAGPPAGAVGFLGFMAICEATNGRDMGIGALSFLNGLPFIVVVAYVLGALPALLSAFVMASFLKRGLRFGTRLLLAMPVGALASLLLLSWLIAGPDSDVPKWVVVANIAATGAVAALVSTLVLQLFLRSKVAA